MQKPHPVPISRDRTCGLPSCGFWEHMQFASCRNFLDMSVQSTTDNHPGFGSNSSFGVNAVPSIWHWSLCIVHGPEHRVISPYTFCVFGGRVITHMLQRNESLGTRQHKYFSRGLLFSGFFHVFLWGAWNLMTNLMSMDCMRPHYVRAYVWRWRFLW